jgi:hypothetical protein
VLESFCFSSVFEVLSFLPVIKCKISKLSDLILRFLERTRENR